MLSVNTLGQEPLGPDTTTRLTPEQEKAIAEFVVKQIELEQKVAQLKETRSRHFWGAVAGVATVATTLIAVITFARKKD